MPKKTIIFDLDKTLCTKKKPEESYLDVLPLKKNIEILNKLHDMGYEIIIETARNMVTQNNYEAKAIRNIGWETLEWLKRNNIKYDGIKFGKTYGIAYVDDKSLRPEELECLYDNNKLNDIEEYLDNNTIEAQINYYLNLLNNKYYIYKAYNIQNSSLEYKKGYGIPTDNNFIYIQKICNSEKEADNYLKKFK